MSSLILVGYATRYGSTQEVAEAIAAALREEGIETDIRPMREVRTLAGYSAVVLSRCSKVLGIIRRAKPLGFALKPVFCTLIFSRNFWLLT